jgi:hypothetical protein
VDADVLIRNVDYAVRHGYVGALTRHASTRYSLTTGVALFASVDAAEEVQRHLPDIAERRQVAIDEVRRAWAESFAPAIRFVDVPDDLIDDPRIDGTDPKDRHTARLACLLAPAILATDNRKHFKPFALAATKTDNVAIDLAAVGQFITGAKGAAIIPTATGALTIEGSKKVVAKLGKRDALLVGAVLIGALVLFLTSERGRAMGSRLGEVAEELAPKLADLIESVDAASDRVHAFAIDPIAEPGPIGLLARRLATEKTVMTTVEVADWLGQQGLGFKGQRDHRAQTRAWLVRTACFEEVSRGRWALGHHRLSGQPPGG